jgi:hypothetical protein
MLGLASTLNLVEEALRLIVVEELTKRARMQHERGAARVHSLSSEPVLEGPAAAMIHWSAVTVVSTLMVRNSVQRLTISASVSARSPSSLGSRWASRVST